MLDPGQTFAQTMLTTGWVFGAFTAVAILVAGVGLLLTALRNRPSAESGVYGELDEEVVRARDAWHEALLERGILPPSSGRHSPSRAPRHCTVRHRRHRRHRPAVCRTSVTAVPGSPARTAVPEAGPRPRYSSPDYSSPDFGGPEHRPE